MTPLPTIDNLIILNLILIGMFALFLGGYMLPEYHSFGGKKRKPFYGSKFSVTVGMENSDFSILTHVSVVLSWKTPMCSKQ